MNVRVNIKDPMLRSYLAGLFDRRDDGYAVDMDTTTGAVICSLVRESSSRVHHDDNVTTVTFYLPNSRYTSSLRNKWLYVTPEVEARINAVLRKEFDTNFTAFCTDLKISGMKIKDIVTLFIVKNQMDIFDGDIETLKKRYYRHELETLKKMENRLRQKAYLAVYRTKKALNIAAIL